MGPTGERPSDGPAAPQFTLRSVLLTVAAVAMVSAICAPSIRALPGQKRFQPVVFLAAFVGAATVSAVIDYRTHALRSRWRKQNEPMHGAHLLSVPNPNLRITTTFNWMLATVTSFGACLGGYLWLQDSSAPIRGLYVDADRLAFLVALLLAGSAGWFTAGAIGNRFLAANWLELCSNGVVFAHARFLVWKEFQGYSWQSYRGKLLLALEWTKLELLPIPSELREPVDRILAERVGRVEERSESATD